MFIALLLPSLIAKFDLQRLVLFTHVIHVKIYVWLYYNESYDVDIAILVLVSCIIIINISFITLIIMSSFKHAQVLLTKRSSGGEGNACYLLSVMFWPHARLIYHCVVELFAGTKDCQINDGISYGTSIQEQP